MQDSIDYRAVGLKVGLEVHQQLLTAKKLFCRCPAGLYTREHDGTVLRHMRPTLSELGEYDGTALMEFKTRKNIVYLLHRETTCTYEMDDTPPFLVNEEALEIAVEQCLMLGCDIVDEVHIARKQYLDGSIPTGFQRTAVVGVNGRIPFRDRELTITQVTLEEDSCREVSDRGHLIVWRTDRLGMPLIETVTGAELRTPEEVEEAILLIGRVCRSTGHVRTGLGASRQDVNVSVAGGRRVEIKGVPRAALAARLVHGEAIRQVNLLRIRDELHRRGVRSADGVVSHVHDVTELFREGPVDLLTEARWRSWLESTGRRPGFEVGTGPFTVRAVRLPGLAGILAHPTQPGRTFAHELAGRVRVIATLDQPPVLLHSEAWPAGAGESLEALRSATGAGPEDALVVVWGAADDTETAAAEIRLRVEDATEGVPLETRQPFPDGSTDFERILPGPDRMYPDTDSPPHALDPAHVERLRAALPEPPWEREARYAAAGVPLDETRFLIRRGGSRLVDRLVDGAGADLKRAALFVARDLKAARRGGLAVDAVPDGAWVGLFALFAERPVLWEARREIVEALAASPALEPVAAVRELGLGEPPGDWEARVLELAATVHPDHPDGSVEQRLRFLMGRAMRGLRGRVPAREVLAVLRNELEVQA